jgi:sorbitol/mannitol transport system permease protein
VAVADHRAVTRGQESPPSRTRARRRSSPWPRRLPLLPALVFTIVVTQVPFLFTLYYSLTDWKIVPPTPQTFVGLANYIEGYTNRFFLEAVGTSIVMTVSAVLGSLVVGTALALLLDRNFPGRGIARTLLITPFLVMPVVAGLVWTNQMFSTQFGVLNWVITGLGLDAVSFVQEAPTLSIVTVLIWQWAPFMMLIVLAGLQGQPLDILEAARVDGASGLKIFRHITLPLLRPYLELGTLLGSIYLVQVFDHVEVITGGGPGSTNVPFFVYQRSIGGGWEFGQASAYGVIVVIASIIIANFALRLLSNLISKEASA